MLNLFSAVDLTSLLSSAQMILIAFIQVGLLFVGLRYIKRALREDSSYSGDEYDPSKADTRVDAEFNWYGRKSNENRDYMSWWNGY